LPEVARHRELFESARSLVLVDDEASTGATFVNLVRAFKARIPSIQQIVTTVITDWRGPMRTAHTLAQMPVQSCSIAILEGEYQFKAAANLVATEMPKSVGDAACKDHLLPRNQGRFGLSGRTRLDGDVYRAAFAGLAQERGAVNSNDKLLVLGTGEFAYPPFLLAEELEAAGLDVHYQSTTRSPALIGGALACGLTFADNYGDRIANYVYNVAPGQYERVIIAHETPAGSIDETLTEALQATTLEI
jgi:hypothetical protein